MATGTSYKKNADHVDQQKKAYILALDVGTTNIKCFLYDQNANILVVANEKMDLLNPKPGWVEIDPEILWVKVQKVLKDTIQMVDISIDDVACMGITTQRNTFITWDRETHEYFHNFITWQDLRASEMTKSWNQSYTMKAFNNGSKALHAVTRQTRFLAASVLRFKTAQVTMRLLWQLQNNEKLNKRIEDKQVQFGNIDTWLLWKLTDGESFATDYSNASSSGIFDPFQVEWSTIVSALVSIPLHIFPPIQDTSSLFGHTHPSILGKPIPITSLVADQQSALFGQCCFNVGDMNCSVGTGGFIDTVTGNKPHASVAGLYPLVGWKIGNELTYVAEGYASDLGVCLEWAQEIGFFNDVSETSDIAKSVPDSGGVYFVPGFSGIQTPINNDKACTSLIGINMKTTKPQIIRAILEGIAFRCYLLHKTVLKETKVPVSKLCRVDGGVSNNDFLMQLISDLTDCDIERPDMTDMTALGAAFHAGLAAGVWKDKDELLTLRQSQQRKVFKPQQSMAKYKSVYDEWHRAVKRCLDWYHSVSI